MQDWSTAQLEAVMADTNAPVSKKAAARCWLDAASKDRTSSGNPIAGGEIDRIMDRTNGRPYAASASVSSTADATVFTLNIGNPARGQSEAD